MKIVGRTKKNVLYECICPDCGKIRHQDKRKIGKPCAPCSAKRRSTHGLSNSPIYKLLKNMVARCKYPSATHWKYYGGRGVTVCDEWAENPVAFYEWALANDYKEGMEIDRKDNNGPYAPWNCRFISHQINSQKRSNCSCTLEIAKKIKESLNDGTSLKEAAIKFGVPYMVVWHINKGNTWRNA